MTKVKLSMPVAFLIENCLTSGLPNDRIIQALRNKQFSMLLNYIIDKDMDLLERLKIAEELEEDWEHALNEGYELKWLHLNGLKKLLFFRFNKVIDRNFGQEELVIHSLTLNEQEYNLLSSMISRQWVILSENDGEGGSNPKYRIELKFKL